VTTDKLAFASSLGKRLLLICRPIPLVGFRRPRGTNRGSRGSMREDAGEDELRQEALRAVRDWARRR
jgi:hypothetical protein